MQELKVVLKKSENLSFGFSLLGTAGLPHVIYDICENSPAAECGEVSQFSPKTYIKNLESSSFINDHLKFIHFS